jgi:hypothetical protein
MPQALGKLLSLQLDVKLGNVIRLRIFVFSNHIPKMIEWINKLNILRIVQ